MKKVITAISTFIVAVFLCWAIISNHSVIQYSNYPAVTIIGAGTNSSVVDRETFTKELNTLAKSTDSLIARRIVEPNASNVQSFTYEFYGEKASPEAFKKASEESCKTSDLANSYLLLEGDLSPDTLLNKFTELGYSSYTSPPDSVLVQLLSITMSDTAIISLVVLLLTFAALTVIMRIKDFRYAGIRLLSGMSMSSVMFKSFIEDLKYITVIFLLTSVLAVGGLVYFKVFEVITVKILVLGIFLYSLALILISFVLSLIYMLALKKDSLLDIIKGKLPLVQLSSIMFIGQLLSMIIVGITLNQVRYNLSAYKEQNLAQDKWEENSNLYNISFGMSVAGNTKEVNDYQNKLWYSLADQAVNYHDGMFVLNNLKRFMMSDVDQDGVTIDTYDPLGNTIYVTPNYLVKEGIQLEDGVVDKLMNLERGEFGLIMPNKLKEDSSKYIKDYTEMMQVYGQENGSVSYNFEPIVAYVEDGKDRFLYNITYEQQYLKDPIIVVITPSSMGDTYNSVAFWAVNIGDYMLFDGYDNTIDLLKANDVYSLVSYVNSGKLTYLARTQALRTELVTLIAGAFMGIISAVLLFSTINLLYFEQFRREIFIRRLSGMSFFENHKIYMLMQLLALGISSVCVIFITKDVFVTFLTVALFLVVGTVLLYRQVKKEDKLAVTVMKGK